MASVWMWAGPSTAIGHIPETRRTLQKSVSKPAGADPVAVTLKPWDTPVSPNIWMSRPVATIRTTRTKFLPVKSSRHTGFSPKDPGSKPRPLAPDSPGPPVPLLDPLLGSSSSRSTKSSLGFISTPLIWPGRKRPSRGSHLLTTRVPVRQVDNITKPTRKPTVAPHKHLAVLAMQGFAYTPQTTEDPSVSGQGFGQAAPPLPSSSAVSNRKNKPALPKWLLENQTVDGGIVEDDYSSLLEQLVHNMSRFSDGEFSTTFSTEEPASVSSGYTDPGISRLPFSRPNEGTRHILHGLGVLFLDSGVVSQNLASVMEMSMSSDLQNTFEVTGDAGVLLAVSMPQSHASVVDRLLSSDGSSDTNTELQMFSRTVEHLQISSEPPVYSEAMSDTLFEGLPAESVNISIGDGTKDPLPLVGETTVSSFAGEASEVLSETPAVSAVGVTPTLTRFDRPDTSGWDPSFMSTWFHTGGPQPSTGVHPSERTLPDHVIQTHPVPLCPGSFCLPQMLLTPSIEPSFPLPLSAPPLFSFIPSLPLTHHHMSLDAPNGTPSLPDVRSSAPAFPSNQISGLDLSPPTPRSRFSCSSTTRDFFVVKLLPPAESTKQSTDTVDFKKVPVSNRTSWTTFKDLTKAKNATAEAAHMEEPPVATRESEAAVHPAMNVGTAERPTPSRLDSRPGQSQDSWTGSTDPPDGLVRDLFLTLAALFDEPHFTATTKSRFPAVPIKTVGDDSGSIKDTAPPVPGSGTAKHSLKCPCKQRSQCQCGLSPGNKGFFYRIFFMMDEVSAALTHADVERAAAVWLNQTFQNWTHAVTLDHIRVQLASQNPTRYRCQALLVYYYTTNQTLSATAVSARMAASEGQMGSGLQVQPASTDVTLIENCPEENPLHYRWPESRPTVTQNLPCFPNKDQSASRTCLIDSLNLSSYWSPADLSNCTDIDTIKVSAENAAEVADQLADITNNELTNEEVSKVVMKVKQLVNVANISSSLASTVVTIISNVLSSSETALAPTSETALKTVDELVQKLEFEGPSISITSRHLSVGVSSFNTSTFNGSSFSAFLVPNTSEPQIHFESDQMNPLAQVTLPASLLSAFTLTEAELSSMSRINFMFFSSTNLFQSEQAGHPLISYVVASSVGNISISDLTEPVQIEIAHLSDQAVLSPVCVFWDFSLSDGAGGWNGAGCRVSKESSSNRTICLCDHLTHFGILLDVSGASTLFDPKNNKILTFITYIGCGISSIFSAATLLTYIAFEKLRRDYPSKILMNLSTSLLFLNMVFLLDGWLASLDLNWLCLAVAVLLHYFLLTSFTWMGLESIHMYIALVKVFNTYIRRYILKFCIVGWGLPAVLVGIVVASDKNSYGLQKYGTAPSAASEFCWIQAPLVFYTTCVGYFCLVFLLNVAMFIVVMLQICGRNGKRSNRTLREEVLRNLRSVVSLTFLLGMTWGFALFAWGPVSLAFMYLFTIFNSLQGLFIFIFHCALKENVQKQWRRFLCCGRFRLSENSDWSKTATNNTKKVSSDNLGKSVSSSSCGSSATNWTSKAKATLNPFSKRHSTTDKRFSSQTNPKSSSTSSEVQPNSSSSSILPVSQMIDKVKDYCSTRSDNFYKNIIMSDSFTHSTKF